MQMAKLCFWLCVVSVIAVTSQPLQSADWPMWRHDSQRSGASPDAALSVELQLQWSRDLGPQQPAWPEDPRLLFDASYEPVVLGQTMFVGSARTDSVTAIDTRTGDQKWQFFAEGPIRFAPVAWKDRIYFGADDGCLYCLEAKTGKLIWKHDATPDARKVIGNSRMISVWPVRGGPVLTGGKLYFIAGMWPFEGVFLNSVDIEGSRTRPDVEVSTLPPDVLAQGYLAAGQESLLIPCGRKPAVQFNRATETFSRLGYDFKGAQDYHLTASGPLLFHGSRVFNCEEKSPVPFGAYHPVTVGSRVYTVQSSSTIVCFDTNKPLVEDATERKGNPIKKKSFPVQWRLDSRDILRAVAKGGPEQQVQGNLVVSILAGNRLYGHWGNIVFAVDLPTKETSTPKASWAATVVGDPATMLAADGRLFVVTREGTVLCFGGEKIPLRNHPLPQSEIKSTPSADKVARLLERTRTSAGYCLVLGTDSGQLIDELVRQSKLRVVVLDPDADKIHRIRQRFSQAGIYGTRVEAITGDLSTLSLPSYMANLVVSEDIKAAGTQRGKPFAEALYATLRPYGGVARLELDDKASDDLSKKAKLLPKALLQREGPVTMLTRHGALEGAGTWTDEYADPANTMTSRDSLVKAPLGVLWFGGPAASSDLFYDRHQWSPSLAVIEGRMFIEGPQKLTAVDVYTGRILWQVPLQEGLSPGRRGTWRSTGFHFVADEDGIYLTYEKKCLVYNPATGEKVAELTLPEEKDRFGRIRIWKDLLIVPVFDTVQQYGDVPVKIVAMDRSSGKIVWTKKSELSFPFLAIGRDRVYAFEGMMAKLYENRDRKGRVPEAEPIRRLKAFDARTGNEIWCGNTDRIVTWLSYAENKDVLVASDKHGVEGWNGSKGTRLWSRTSEGRGFRGHPENLWDKVILWKDRVIDQRGPGRAYDLLTGEPVMCEHPVTGESVPWEFTKNGHHCGYVIASENLLTFRAATAAYTDMATGGTTHLYGFRSGCRNSLIPADGVLSAPNFAYGCVCSYSVFTSLALVHQPEVEKWAYSAIRRSNARIKRVGINFGAPGDREVEDGSLWLDYPRKSGPSPDIAVQVTPERPRVFRTHASEIEGDGLRWVAASGVEGITSVTVPLSPGTSESKTYTLRLYFTEPGERQPGERVFDVILGKDKLLSDFDVAKEAGGGNTMIVKEFKKVATTGSLQLTFKASKGTPVLCGLEVVAE